MIPAQKNTPHAVRKWNGMGRSFILYRPSIGGTMVGPGPCRRWLDAEDSTSSPLQTHMAGFPSHHKYQKTVRIKITGMQYVLSAPFVPGEESPSYLPTQSETHIYRRGQWILYIQSGHCPHSCIAPKEYTEHWMRYATASFLLSAA